MIARDSPALVPVIAPRPSTPDSRLSLVLALRDVSGISTAQPLDVRSWTKIASPASINTLVTMDVGETIVVGTSRVKGSGGILVLLTALPHPGE
jgi:hypothetical protein